MVTGQQPCTLQGQPALRLELRALRTRPMPTRVVPDTRHVTVGARLDMAAQRGGPTLHEGTRGPPDMGGQGMGAFVLRIAHTTDVLQGQEPQRVPTRATMKTLIALF
jgi:hypothetical protein